MLLLLKQSHENYRSKTPRCSKLSNSSVMQSDPFMHREDAKG